MIILNFLGTAIASVVIIIGVVLFLIIGLIIKWYQKPVHGRALVRSGNGGTKVQFDRGLFVIPVLHKIEIMDITLKTITISRTEQDGLICKDNMRADIKVSFFVRVNRTVEDVTDVAFAIGCERASREDTLLSLFDSKFSEALKTVGKRFDFVDLYNSREGFKREIIEIIGRDLNGYYLDDVAIDYLEQTSLAFLKADNILDSEGIKKIAELTSTQQILANQINREREKTIRKQDVEARETILELNKQLAEKEEQQRREIESIKNREQAEIDKVRSQQKLISETARIETEQTIAIAEENKERQIIVAQRNKERVSLVELEKVEKDRQLEINERERIVTLAQIEKEKAVEEEKKNIQDIIRERVIVQKTVVQEEEKIKDTQAFALAQREKEVAITNAEKLAQQDLVKQIKKAEAERQAADYESQTRIIHSEAAKESAVRDAAAQKVLAEAKAANEAAIGISEAQVTEAKANASMVEGQAIAKNIELKAVAESKGILAKASAEAEGIQKIGASEAVVVENKGVAEANVITAKAVAEKNKGMAEADVMKQKYFSEADGVKQKAEAMKLLDSVGKDHEEFKLELEKDKQIQLARINIQKDIAMAQAEVISSALKVAKIDIVGGETMFFDQIIGSITRGKSIDRMVNNSELIREVKDKFLPDFDVPNPENPEAPVLNFKDRLKYFVEQFGMSSNDVKNLTISALIFKLTQKVKNNEDKTALEQLLDLAISKGIDNIPAKSLGLK